jgi:hypothetical protein
MEVAGLTIRVLELETAVAKIHPPRHARVDHPLQSAVDGRPTDAGILAAHQVNQLVRAQVACLPEKDRSDGVALAGTPPARRATSFNEFGWGRDWRHGIW